MSLMELKSGTDIRGVASEGVIGESINLTNEAVFAITTAFVAWLKNKLQDDKKELRISVGHDSRISAARIKEMVVSALNNCNVHVLDCGLSSTPAMFMTTVELDCDAAVQITASHHPWHRNGLKFFTREGGLAGGDIASILTEAENEESNPEFHSLVAEKCNYMKQYAANLRKMICDGVGAKEEDKPLSGWKIAVDAGNGVGGFYAFDVLEKLGADVSASQFTEPDGMFPNHIPNPENPTAMEAISKAVVESNSDFGIIFDTDVDRAACVDSTGKEINRNRLVALASAIALEGNEGGTIVTDSVTSSGLKMFIENTLGGVHCRFKRGYKNVINEQIRLNESGVNCPLAIETSGHAAFKDNYYLDDGAYLITKIIIKMARLRAEGKTINSLLSDLKEPAEAKEIRFRILEQDFKAYGLSVIDRLEAYAQQQSDWHVADDNHEGIRVSVDNVGGWFLLRLSVHDPIMPFNIESDKVGGVEQIVSLLKPFFASCDGLDISVL